MMEKASGTKARPIPGAGFDLVALHFTRGKNVEVFELDQTATLQVKVETLDKAGIAHDWITYVPVDYSSESWVDKLVTTGFDRTKKTLFLWQSVSLFLEPDAVKKTLREMAGLCAEGSIIAQDFYSRAFVSGETSRAARRTSSSEDGRALEIRPGHVGRPRSGDQIILGGLRAAHDEVRPIRQEARRRAVLLCRRGREAT